MANVKISEITQASKLTPNFLFLGAEKTYAPVNYTVSYDTLSATICDYSTAKAAEIASDKVEKLSTAISNDVSLSASALYADIHASIWPTLENIGLQIDNLSSSFKTISTAMSNQIDISVDMLSTAIDENSTTITNVSVALCADYTFKINSISSYPSDSLPGLVKKGDSTIFQTATEGHYGLLLSSNGAAYVTVPISKSEGGVPASYPNVMISALHGEIAVNLLSNENYDSIKSKYASSCNWYYNENTALSSVKLELVNIKDRVGTLENTTYRIKVDDITLKFVQPTGSSEADTLSVIGSKIPIATKSDAGTIKINRANDINNRNFGLSADELGLAYVHVPDSGSSSVKIDNNTIKKSTADELYVDTANLTKASSTLPGVVKLGYEQSNKNYPLCINADGNAFTTLPVIGADEKTIKVDTNGKVYINKEFFYPVDSIVMNTTNRNPGNLDYFGFGEWENITSDDASTIVKGYTLYIWRRKA